MGGIFPDPGDHATSKKSRYGLRIAKFCDDDGRLLVNDPRRGTGRCRKIDHGIDLRENTPFTFYRIRGRTIRDIVALQQCFPIPLEMHDAKWLKLALERFRSGCFEEFRNLTQKFANAESKQTTLELEWSQTLEEFAENEIKIN